MARARGGATREAVEGPAYQVAGRVAGEAVEGERSGVDQQHERADPDADAAPEARPLEHVAPEEEEVDERDVERIAVEVLEDEGEGGLAAVAVPARLAHRARRRIEEARAVVGPAAAVAGGAGEDPRGGGQGRRGGGGGPGAWAGGGAPGAGGAPPRPGGRRGARKSRFPRRLMRNSPPSRPSA